MHDLITQVLVCPVCKEKVELSQDKTELICQKSQLAYPIENGLPIMLKERARRLDEPKTALTHA